MLQTASRNEVKKRMLEKQFPRVLGMKLHLEGINSITRFLMNVYKEINGHDIETVFESRVLRISLKAHLSTEEAMTNND